MTLVSRLQVGSTSRRARGEYDSESERECGMKHLAIRSLYTLSCNPYHSTAERQYNTSPPLRSSGGRNKAARKGEPEPWFSFVGDVLRGVGVWPISARSTVGMIPARVIA